MFFESKAKKRIRDAGRSAIAPFFPPKTEKFAEKADFFRYPSRIVPAYGKDVYVCLPKSALAFSDRSYVFCDDGLPAQVFPQGKVFSLGKELTVVGEFREERYFSVDRKKERFFYALLALLAVRQREKNKAKKKETERLILEGTPAEVFGALGLSEDAGCPAAIEYPCYPPLFCFPEELIERLLRGAEKTVCFPQGGLWRGLIPVLRRSGVERVILPANKNKEPFRWTEEGAFVDVFYRRIPTREERVVETLAFGLPQEESFISPTKEGVDESVEEVVCLCGTGPVVTDEGSGEGLFAEKDRIGNGSVEVLKKKGAFVVPEKGVRISLLYTDGKRRCGTVSEKSFISGRFALFEAHYYYREATTRVRILLETGKKTLRIDLEGVAEGFTLAVETEGIETVERELPFGDERNEEDGVNYARGKITVEGKNVLVIKTVPVIYEKKGNTLYFPLRSFVGKRSFTID